MRIIKCYIDNFGLLHDIEFNFKKGINCCLSDNGTGKTTLASFIEAMFYGIGDTRKQMLDENPRKKYNPWQGGKYGGALTFEIGKKRYTAERSFAQKAADDTFRLIDADTGNESSDYSESIGEEIFGIDRDGFLRTVFLSEKNLQGKNENRSISAKLSDLVGVDGDVGGFDDALRLLEDRRKFYHKKNNTGEIANVQAQISEHRRKLDEISRLENDIKLKKDKLSSLNTAREALVSEEAKHLGKLGELSKMQQRLSHEERYSAMLSALKAENDKLIKAKDFFKGGIPTLKEIDDARYACLESQRLKKEAYDESDDNEYLTLRRFFEGGTTFSEISEIESSASELAEKTAELERISAKRDIRSIEMASIFPGSIPSRDEIENVKKANKSRLSTPKIIVSTVCIIFGALCAIAGTVNGGIPFYIAGAVFAAIASGVLFISKSNGAVKEFCKRYSDNDTRSYDIAFKNIISSLERYERLRDERELAKAELEERIASLKLKIYSFLGKFPIDGSSDIYTAIRHIKSDFTRYYSLDKADKMQETGKIDKIKRSEALERASREFAAKFHTETSDPFTEIRERLNEYNQLTLMVHRLEEECSQYASRYGVTGNARAAEDVNADALNGALAEVRERITALNRECAMIESEIRTASHHIDKKDELEASLAELYELLKQHTENLEVIKKTSVLLREACDTITAKYLGKTKQKFEEYSSVIDGHAGDFLLNTEFEYSKTERGISRGNEAYSRGLRDLYAIAMRFALIDALYDKESPFIVLDDPFIALDDTRTERAKGVLKELGKGKQILYFTCSKAREII